MKRMTRNRFIYSVFLGCILLLPSYDAHAAMLQTQWASSCPAGWVSTGITDDNFDSYHHLGEGFVQGAIVQLCIKSDDASITLFSEWNAGATCSTDYSFMNLYDDLGDTSQSSDLPSLHDTNENSYLPSGSNDNHWCLKATGDSSTSIVPLWRVWNSSNTDGPGCQSDETVIMDGINSVFNLNHAVHTGANESSLCLKIVSDGACGSANGVEVSSAPSTDLCLVGTASAVSGTGPWTWNCTGINGGVTASCSAPKTASVPPTDPIVTGTATYTNTSYPFTFTSTDPNGDPLWYGIDWNGDGTTDELAPASGTVPSGTPQSVNHQWAVAGDYVFKVRAIRGASIESAWVSTSIHVEDQSALPVALITASPETVAPGNSTTLTYTCSGGTSAFINNGVGTVVPATGGSTVVTPAQTTTYELICTNAAGSAEDSVVVTVAPPGSLSCTVSNQNPEVGELISYTVTPSSGAAGPYTWDDSNGGTYGTGNKALRTMEAIGIYAMSVQGMNAPEAFCPQVTVGANSCSQPSSGTITATPSRVNPGGSTVIAWTLNRGVGVACHVTGPGLSVDIPIQATCEGPIPVYEDNSSPQTITAQSTYVITCDSVQVARKTVNVIPAVNEF
ncbi:MAG: hypothetical protein AAB472_03310 [Patescibacteria group bacterium]